MRFWAGLLPANPWVFDCCCCYRKSQRSFAAAVPACAAVLPWFCYDQYTLALLLVPSLLIYKHLMLGGFIFLLFFLQFNFSLPDFSLILELLFKDLHSFTVLLLLFVSVTLSQLVSAFLFLVCPRRSMAFYLLSSAEALSFSFFLLIWIFFPF